MEMINGFWRKVIYDKIENVGNKGLCKRYNSFFIVDRRNCLINTTHFIKTQGILWEILVFFIIYQAIPGKILFIFYYTSSDYLKILVFNILQEISWEILLFFFIIGKVNIWKKNTPFIVIKRFCEKYTVSLYRRTRESLKKYSLFQINYYQIKSNFIF